MKYLLLGLSMFFPRTFRRSFLQSQFEYEIHPSCRLGLCWLSPTHLVMEEGSEIGHFTVCKSIDRLHLKPHASIGRGNWITGFPLGPSPHFAEESDRRPELILEEHAAVTHRHLIDCTNSVVIGRYTTFAGFQSQILTHSIDLERNRQASAPVRIGEYCFVGTNSVLLPGSVLPDYSVLGAKSLLNRAFTDSHHLYGGVPAAPIKPLPANYAYFQRTRGFVV